MSYTEYVIENTKNKRIMIMTDIHNCQFDWYGVKNEDRMNLMCEAVSEEDKNSPFDAILCLGDYSLDFWKWNEGGSYLWNPPVSRTAEFMEKYYPRFPKKAYMIPGNHEQYKNEDWIRITGFPREFAVMYGDFVFAMLDTFGGELDPKENHDGVYTGINTAFVREILKNHPDKKIILCAHDILPDKESDETKYLICEEKRILCAFTGHTHLTDTKLLDDSFRNLPVFYCGNFSYYKLSDDKTIRWGYRILDFNNGKFSADFTQVIK